MVSLSSTQRMVFLGRNMVLASAMSRIGRRSGGWVGLALRLVGRRNTKGTLDCRPMRRRSRAARKFSAQEEAKRRRSPRRPERLNRSAGAGVPEHGCERGRPQGAEISDPRAGAGPLPRRWRLPSRQYRSLPCDRGSSGTLRVVRPTASGRRSLSDKLFENRRKLKDPGGPRALRPDSPATPAQSTKGDRGWQQRRPGEQLRKFGLRFHRCPEVSISSEDASVGLCEYRVYYGRKRCPDATGMVRPPTNTSVTRSPDRVASR